MRGLTCFARPDLLPGWPWVPGVEQSQVKSAEGRARTGSTSATLFQAWMQKVGRADQGAAAAQLAPAPAAADEAMGGR